MKRKLAPIAVRLGVAAGLRRRTRGRLRILMYHGVVERPLEPFCWHQLPVDAFRAQLTWVRERFEVLPLEEALERMEAGTLPDNACAITFDDGYRNNLTVAEPVLRELGLPATIFLPTEVVGTDELLWPDRAHLARMDLEELKRVPVREKEALLEDIVRAGDVDLDARAEPFRLLSWDEVERLRAGGLVTFAPHSTTHEILSQCDDDAVRAQVLDSCAALAGREGRPPRVFAYPNGRAQDFDDRARAALTEAGVRWALSTEPGLNGPESDRLALRRVSVGADLDLATFRLLVSGWQDPARVE